MTKRKCPVFVNQSVVLQKQPSDDPSKMQRLPGEYPFCFSFLHNTKMLFYGNITIVNKNLFC